MRTALFLRHLAELGLFKWWLIASTIDIHASEACHGWKERRWIRVVVRGCKGTIDQKYLRSDIDLSAEMNWVELTG
jgi:hypothetical protein